MSYLHRPRLTFAGSFQADVPTGNNDPTLQGGSNWNPLGGGQFRLVDCAVTSVVDDGDIGDGDPVHGAAVTDAADRVSAKIVDLDPQWQLASELYGLQVRLVANGAVLMTGEFEPAGFRDLTRHARYVSVLTDITWAPPGTSGFLDRLRAATEDDMVAIRLMTYRYRPTFGSIVGTVGPYRSGEPHRFVAGRHLRRSPGSLAVNEFDAVVDGGRLTVDLANSLAVDGPGAGAPFRLGLLLDPDAAAGTAVTEGSTVITLGGPLPTDASWLTKDGGVLTVDLPAAALDKIDDHPLALLRGDAQRTVAIRETFGGWLVRADHESLRVDPGVPESTRIRVTRYGRPQDGVALTVRIGDPAPPPSGGPPINTPPDRLKPQVLSTTTGGGWAELRIDGDQQDDTVPRPGLDGQIYEVIFQLAGGDEQDMIHVHLYEKHHAPDEPTWWEHVEPILRPYAQQYPVMTDRVFDLSKVHVVKARRTILLLALTLPLTDPNHMPVTRDLSAAKRATILRWLAEPDPIEGTEPTPHPAPAPAPAQPSDADPADAGDGSVALAGKIRSARRQAEVLGREEPPL